MSTDYSGRNIGPYRIYGKVGAGGMASVYRGFQESMERQVAIKILPETLALDTNFMGRFEREAKTIARLEHARILPVYDFGNDDGLTYIVMRYLTGGTLDDLLHDDRPDLQRTVTIIEQVAEGLDYAHNHGVIHRDVKPSNIMFDESGDVYLTDFGIAKLMEGSSTFTGSAVIGTPAYISPEQAMGEEIDARTDIYSLGVVLYEMVTGKLPFDAETPMGIVIKHISEPLPPPREVNSSVPPAVESVIMKALAKDPAMRFQTCGEMAKALRAAIDGGQAVAVPPTSAVGSTADPASTTPMEPAAQQPLKWNYSGVMVAGMAAALLLLVIILGVVVGPGRVRNFIANRSAEPATVAETTAINRAACEQEPSLFATRFPGEIPAELVSLSTNAAIAEVAGSNLLRLEATPEETAVVVFSARAGDSIFETSISVEEEGDDVFLMATRATSDNPQNGYSVVFVPSERAAVLLRQGETITETRDLPPTREGDINLVVRTTGSRVEVYAAGERVITFTDSDPLPAGGFLIAALDGTVDVRRAAACEVTNPAGGSEVLFEEGFNGEALSSRLKWVGVQTEWTLTENLVETDLISGSGVAQVAGVPAMEMPALGIETISLDSQDYYATVAVDIDPQENYQAAGLVLMTEDERPLITLARGYCDDKPSCEGDAIYLEPWTAAGERRLGATMAGAGTLPDGPVLLRFAVGQGQLTASYSVDGGETFIVVEQAPLLASARVDIVGMFTSAGLEEVESIPVRFEGFQITAGQPPEAESAAPLGPAVLWRER